MSKSLNVVQKTSRVLEIICRVLSILCLVGAIACLVAVVVMCIMYLFPKVVSDIESNSGRALYQIIGECVIGFIVSAAGFVVMRAHRDYFIMEQKAGTPFTLEGARSFRTLGIVNIVVPVACAIVSAILGAIFRCWDDIRLDFGIGFGIAMVLLSFVLEYGSELESKEPEKTEKAEVPAEK